MKTKGFFIFSSLFVLIFAFLVFKPVFYYVLFYLITNPALGAIGAVVSIIAAATGTIRGITSISGSVSGVGIFFPRVWSRSTLGILVCEGNLIVGLIISLNLLKMIEYKGLTFPSYSEYLEEFIEGDEKIFELFKYLSPKNVGAFCLGVVSGMSCYYSSVSAGIICAAVTLADGKDDSLFPKVVVFELFAGSYGVICLAIVFVLRQKFEV